jgi:hypothetical protein
MVSVPALTFTNQAIIIQDQRDSRIFDLLGVVNDVYALILDAEPLKRIQTQKQALEILAKQTAECAYFISHYARQPSFCEYDWMCSAIEYLTTSSGSRLGHNIVSGVDGKITYFEQAFRRLRATFHEGVALHTELFVLRMVSGIDTISKQQLCALSQFTPYPPSWLSCRRMPERYALRQKCRIYS